MEGVWSEGANWKGYTDGLRRGAGAMIVRLSWGVWIKWSKALGKGPVIGSCV